jgi:hypothetical protein
MIFPAGKVRDGIIIGQPGVERAARPFLAASPFLAAIRQPCMVAGNCVGDYSS